MANFARRHRPIDDAVADQAAARHLHDIWGTDGDDTLFGTSANERFHPGLGSDLVYGGGGSDTLKVHYAMFDPVGPNQSYITGDGAGLYNGFLQAGGIAESVTFRGIARVLFHGTSGDDYIGVTPTGVIGNLRVHGGAGTDELQLFCDSFYTGITLIYRRGPLDFMGGHFTGFEDFAIRLGNGSDHVELGRGDDYILGGGGGDLLNGGGGNDYLVGGAGADMLIGGHGADIFAFTSLADFATGPTLDRIADFHHAGGDKIDLSWIDADPGASGDQPFNVIGSAAFDGLGTAYELRIEQTGAHGFTVQVDTDHDKIADLQFVVHADTLSTSDIVG